MLFFPSKKGLLIGIFLALGGLAASGFTFLGEYMINPYNEQMDPKTFAYSKKITDNYNNYTLLPLIILPSGALIFYIITVKVNFGLSNNEHPETNKETPETSKEYENTAGFVEVTPSEEVKVAFQPPNPKKYWKNLMKIFCSWDLWSMITICGTQGFFAGMLTCTYRPVGDMMGFDRTVMNYTSTFSNLSLLIFVPIWGVLVDKFGFKKLALVICVSSTINSCLFMITISTISNALFSICIVLNVINTGGSSVIYLPFIMKKFGMYYSMEVSGCVNIFTGFLGLACSLIEFLIVVLYQSKSKTPFYISYGIGTGLSVLSFLFIYILNERKFTYYNEDEVIQGKENSMVIIPYGVEEVTNIN